MQNNKRYWLRGGGVGLGISLITIIFSYIIPIVACPDFFRIGIEYPNNQPICNLLFFNPIRSHYPFPQILNEWVPIILILVLIGLVCGWLYGKIKNRNKLPESIL